MANSTTPTFKTSLVEHIFRRVWATNAGDDTAGASLAPDGGPRRRGLESDNESFSEQEDAPAAAQVTKLHPDTLKMSSEFLRLFVLEALHRAQMEAMVDDSAIVEPHHLEQVLAQLLLDF